MYKSLLLFIILGFTAKAQVKVETFKIRKEPTDTIDYHYLVMPGSYTLKKIIEKGRLVPVLKETYLSLYKPSISVNRGILLSDTTIINKSDTFIVIDWYVLKTKTGMYQIGNQHEEEWKVRLNKKSNTLVIENFIDRSGRWNATKKRPAKKLLFKVIKFSFFEVILKDLQPDTQGTVYYFQKFYSSDQ